MSLFGWNEFLFLLQGLRWTLVLTAIGFSGGIVFGLGVALMRASTIRWLSYPAGAWIALFQGTPLLMQMFVC